LAVDVVGGACWHGELRTCGHRDIIEPISTRDGHVLGRTARDGEVVVGIATTGKGYGVCARIGHCNRGSRGVYGQSRWVAHIPYVAVIGKCPCASTHVHSSGGV